MARMSQKIAPSLWFTKEAEEAAKFYASIFPDSRVDRVASLPADSPSGPAGSVKLVDFTLFGQPFHAMSAGPLDKFNHSISLVVHCETQEEIDRYWTALCDGGKAEDCGWVTDKFGVSWQIQPAILEDLIADPDRAKGRRTAEAMLKMKKLNMAALQSAHDATS